MNIVIADDEYYARKAIVQMVKDWNPDAVIIEVEDGQEALTAVDEQRADLVLTDIRMPGLDGIQVAAYIYQHHPRTLVAIISGFDDFAYAQEAIRYKVEHYMLKPVNRQELYPLLDELRDKIKDLQGETFEKALAACLYGNDCQTIRQLLSARYSGRASDHDSGHDPGHDCRNRAEASPPFRTAVLCIDPQLRELLNRTFKNAFQHRSQTAIVMNDKRRDHLLIVSLFRLPLDKNSHKSQIRLILDAVIEKLDPELEEKKRQAVIRAVSGAGISSAYHQYEQLAQSFREAKSAVVQSMIQGQQQLSFHEDTAGGAKYDAGLIHEWTEVFGKRISRQQVNEAAAMVSELLHSASSKQFSAYMLQDWYASTVKTINTLIERAYEDPADAFMEQRSLLDFCSIEQAGDALIDKLVAVADQLKRSEERTDIVASIKEYVEANYRSRIQLDELAKDKYFVDPGYLSRLFKRKSGMRFSSYLLSVRMDKAKQLLETIPDLSVSEVASEVGFNDYSYFIQMYKKVFGETPGKARSGSRDA